MKRLPPFPETEVVALQYDQVHAPRVTAKGSGELAEQILAIAREHDIPIQGDKELVQLLAQIKLGDEIPEALYLVVAKIIAFAYMLKGKTPDDFLR